MLAYFPAVRDRLDVRVVGFNRPRPAVVELLGEENQECPCLVLADATSSAGLPVKTYGNNHFINDHRAIIEYLARQYGISRPAHD